MTAREVLAVVFATPKYHHQPMLTAVLTKVDSHPVYLCSEEDEIIYGFTCNNWLDEYCLSASDYKFLGQSFGTTTGGFCLSFERLGENGGIYG